jgi:hypothetical protein
MVYYFNAKNPSFGILCKALEWKMLVYYLAIWNILLPFGIFWVYCTSKNLATLLSERGCLLSKIGIFLNPTRKRPADFEVG